MAFDGPSPKFTTLTTGTITNATASAAAMTMTANGVQYTGNLTNTAPPAGAIGQLLTASVDSVTAFNINTITNATSLTPTAGIWEVTGVIDLGITTGAGMTSIQGCLATANNNFTAIDGVAPSLGSIAYLVPATLASASPAYTLGPCRMTTAGATVVYLNLYAAGTSAAALTYDATIRAVRVG